MIETEKRNDETQDRVTVLVSSGLLLDSLVAGVVPTRAIVNGEAAERPRIESPTGKLTSVPSGFVALEIATTNWQKGKGSGLVPIHDVVRCVFASQAELDRARATMSPDLGFPLNLPDLSVGEMAQEVASEGLPMDHPDDHSFINQQYGSEAAMTVALLECLREWGPELWTGIRETGCPLFDSVDRGLIVRYVAGLGGVAEPAVETVIDWAMSQRTSEEPPSQRLDDVVDRLQELGDTGFKIPAKFQSNVQDILDGEKVAEEWLLRDDGVIFLRGIAALFRPSTMSHSAVVEFLEMQGDCGPRVRSLATILSAVTSGGFSSLAGSFKNVPDLYALGSCLASGQSERITIAETRGKQGFEVLLDGEVLDRFRDQEVTIPIPDAWEPLSLFAAAQNAGYQKPMEIATGTTNLWDENSEVQLRTYQLPSDVFAQFEMPSRDIFITFFIEFSLPVKTKRKPAKAFLGSLCQRLLAQRVGGEVVMREFPRVRIYRDHHGRDLNHEELKGHIDALQDGVARAVEIYNTLVSEAKKNNSKDGSSTIAS